MRHYENSHKEACNGDDNSIFRIRENIKSVNSKICMQQYTKFFKCLYDLFNFRVIKREW